MPAFFITIYTASDILKHTTLYHTKVMAEGFPAISVAKEDRLEYFKALDVYAVEGNLQPFADLVAGLVDRQLEQYIELSGPQQDMDMGQTPTLQ